MSIQQLLQQLQGYGLDTTQGLGGITGTDFQQAFSGSLGVDPSVLSPNMFTTFSPEAIKGAGIGAYSNLFQSGQEDLASNLIQQSSGQAARRGYGGFAGSMGAQQVQQQARDEFGRGMQGFLGQAMGAKQDVLQSLMNIAQQNQQAALEMTS